MRYLLCLNIILFSCVHIFSQDYKVYPDSSYSQKWDATSGRWRLISSGTYNLYDEFGNLVSKRLSAWDDIQSDWDNKALYEYSYDQWGNLVEEYDYLFNVDIDSPFPIPDIERTSYHFDSSSNTKTIIKSSMYPDSVNWTHYSKYVQVYDSIGRRIQSAQYSYVPVTGEWSGSHWDHYKYSYDNDGNIILRIKSRWDYDLKDWIYSKKEEFSYTQEGDQLTEYHADWNSESERWDSVYFMESLIDNDPKEGDRMITRTFGWKGSPEDEWDLAFNKLIYQYFLPQVPSSISIFEWADSIQNWVKSKEESYTYNSKGMILEHTYAYKGLEDSTAYNTSKTTYAYNELDSLIEKSRYDWSREKSEWIPQTGTFKNEFIYNDRGLIIQTNNFRWDETSNSEYLSSKSLYDYDIDAYDNIIREVYTKIRRDVLQTRDIKTWSYNLVINHSLEIEEGKSNNLAEIKTGKEFDDRNIKYSIADKISENYLRIDSVTGIISLPDSLELDYETTKEHELIIKGTVNGPRGIIEDFATITLQVLNINDNAPVVRDTLYEILENGPLGEIIDTIAAYDLDGDLNPLIFTIDSGNDDGFFEIERASGILKLAPGQSLDYETDTIHRLNIIVSDSTFHSTAKISVRVLDELDTDIIPGHIQKPFTIYPNPCTNFTQIKYKGHGYLKRLVIMDVAGKYIQSVEADSNEVLLPVRNLSPGIYFLKIYADNLYITRFLVLE